MKCKRKTSVYKEHLKDPEKAMKGLITTWCGETKHHDETVGRWATSDCVACQIAYKREQEKSKAYQKGKMIYSRSRYLYQKSALQ